MVLDAVAIDVMKTVFHLPKSTKFESFQMFSTSFLNGQTHSSNSSAIADELFECV